MTHDEVERRLGREYNVMKFAKSHVTPDEPNEAVCQNPQCHDVYESDDTIPDDDPDSVLCPDCRFELEPVEKWNIRYACENGLESGQILRAVMNGGAK